MKTRRWLWFNALSLVMFGAFATFLVLQSIFGWRATNAERVTHDQTPVAYVTYLSSGSFIEATFENWESEFLQMGSYVLLTAYLMQRGSAESKPIKSDRNHAPRPRTFFQWIYNNSLAIALLAMFAGSFVLHLLGGTAAYNEEQATHNEKPVSVGKFLLNPEFWHQSMQNWQSEFLAVGVLIVASIYLRQQGSPQSKKVTDPDGKTGN